MEKGLKDDAEACADASSNQLKAHESMIKPAKQRTRDDDESVNESGETRTDDNLEQTSLKRAKIDEGGEKSDAKLVEAYAETTTGLNESDKKISMPDSVASHYNAVPNLNVKERTQSKIFYLRNFNNWIKSMLIGEFLERLKNEGCPFATVLDLCCGKGGDLRKWKIGNIKEIVMADIAEVALNHCRDRYNELRDRFTNERRRPFNAHFVLVDATKDDVMACDGIPDRDMRFDICSCQFALHYSFESEAKARCLLWNATHALRPGGYFIATISDANVIL